MKPPKPTIFPSRRVGLVHAELGQMKLANASDLAVCVRCGLRPIAELNTEARIHHGARELVCLDRKACERRARKYKRKARR